MPRAGTSATSVSHDTGRPGTEGAERRDGPAPLPGVDPIRNPVQERNGGPHRCVEQQRAPISVPPERPWQRAHELWVNPPNNGFCRFCLFAGWQFSQCRWVQQFLGTVP